jgi:vanillate O-demethylase monooxygenase subunit
MARDFQQDDAELTDRIREGQRKIFAQDIDVLEAQQQSQFRNPDRRLANLDIDAGGQYSRRIIEKLCGS